MNIPYVFKVCTKCGKPKVASTNYFHKIKRGKYGLASSCKDCRNKYKKGYYESNKEYYKGRYENNKEYYKRHNKEYYENNKEYYKKHSKEHYENNKECIKGRNKEHYENNKGYYREYKKEYYKNNKERMKEYSKGYRATPQGQVVRFNGNCKRRTMEQSQGKGIDSQQWLEMMKYFDWKCAYSGEPLKKDTRTIDHVNPLNGGGENEIWNLVPMYKNHNCSKRDKPILDWYKEQEFYDEERLQKIYEWQKYAYEKWGTA